MEKFGDPEFLTHATAARLYTVIAMRAAAAEVVPLRFVPYGEALREHVDDLRRIRARQGRGSRPSPAVGGAEPRPSRACRPGRGRSGPSRRRPTTLDRAPETLAGRDGVDRGEALARSTTP